MAPTYKIERDPESADGSTCVLRFTAGPPYEDIAFRWVGTEMWRGADVPHEINAFLRLKDWVCTRLGPSTLSRGSLYRPSFRRGSGARCLHQAPLLYQGQYFFFFYLFTGFAILGPIQGGAWEPMNWGQFERTDLAINRQCAPLSFRIVNKEWEYSHKRGFRCTFERGILHLYFNFLRTRYRR